MAKQAKILSFDEAKRTSSADEPSFSAPRKRRTQGQPSPADGARHRSNDVHRRSNAASCRQEVGQAKVAASPSGRIQGRVSSRGEREGRNSRNESARLRSRAVAGPSESEEDSESSRKQPSRWAKFKRARSKDKADRAFSRQYGDQPASAAGESAGSRAAVYKGEMGASHRRAARMQDEKGGQGVSRRRSAKGFSLSAAPRKLVVSAACAVCVVLACAFLYPTAKQYYLIVRECDQLQAEYDALEERNAALQEEVDSLSTDEGVEDRAREELGWVMEGENAVTVRGLSSDGEDDEEFSANIVSGSVEAPETWYSKLLDPLFGVE